MSNRGGKREGAGRPEGSRSIAPIIREAFLDAIDQLQEEGKPLTTIIKNELCDHPLQTLKVISTFCPKVMKEESTFPAWYEFLAQIDSEERESPKKENS